MKKNTNIILLLIVFVLTVLSVPGAFQRLKNENRNGIINIAADYSAFKTAADKAKIDIFDQLDKMKSNGVGTVLISNKTIRDYEAEGKVALSFVYEIKNSAIKDNYQININTKFNNDLFVIPEPEYYDLIKGKLEKRFKESDLILLEYKDKKAIIIDSELDERVGVNLGFDTDVIEKALARGYKVALSMKNENFGNTAFLDEIDEIFKQYDISYVEINNYEFPGYEEGLERAEGIIEASGAVLMLKGDYGIIDPNQTKGLYDYLKKSDYNAQRTFYIKDYLQNSRIVTPEDYYFTMMRAAVDRGNRFFVIAPLQNNKKTFSETLTDIDTAVESFYNRLKGNYDFDGYVKGSDFDKVSSVYLYFSSLAIIFALLLILINAFSKVRILYFLYILFVPCYLLFGILYQQYLGRMNALLGTIVFPSLFAFFLLKEIKKENVRIFTISLRVIAAFFTTAAVTVICTIANLSSVQNFFGINSFLGVKFAFLIPLLMFFIFFFIADNSLGEIGKKAVDIGRRPVTYFSFALMAIAAAAAYIYIVRSGNESGSLVASFEIQVREFFENLVLARPRTKEILIGYPSIALLIYFYFKKAGDLMLFIFGTGTMVGLISLTNTFCHVNAYVGVSVSRSLYGIASGAFISFLIVAVVYMADKIIKGRNKGKNNV